MNYIQNLNWSNENYSWLGFAGVVAGTLGGLAFRKLPSDCKLMPSDIQCWNGNAYETFPATLDKGSYSWLNAFSETFRSPVFNFVSSSIPAILAWGAYARSAKLSPAEKKRALEMARMTTALGLASFACTVGQQSWTGNLSDIPTLSAFALGLVFAGRCAQLSHTFEKAVSVTAGAFGAISLMTMLNSAAHLHTQSEIRSIMTLTAPLMSAATLALTPLVDKVSDLISSTWNKKADANVQEKKQKQKEIEENENEKQKEINYDDISGKQAWVNVKKKVNKQNNNIKIGNKQENKQSEINSDVLIIDDVKNIVEFDCSSLSKTSSSRTPIRGSVKEQSMKSATRIDAPSLEGRGEVLSDEFTLNGTIVAKEEVNRIRVVQQLGKAHQAHRDYLKSLTDRTKREELVLKLTLDNYESMKSWADKKQTWASSSSYRQLLGDNKEDPANAHKQFLPVCVNFRTHAVVEEGETTSIINRSGAIHDYRFGATNLVDMRNLQKKLVNGNAWTDLSSEEKQVYQVYFPQENGETSMEEIRNNLDEKIIEREWVLENQALQDIAQHCQSFVDVSGKPEEDLMKKTSIVLGRVSMLDGIKEPVRHESGFICNERNQMLDMQAIYNDLNEKKMVFDGTGPYIDRDGKIHLPVKVTDGEKSHLELPLEVIYFNISAQGNVKNEGAQKNINEEAIKKLSKRVEMFAQQLKINPETCKQGQNLQVCFNTLKKVLEREVKDGFATAELAAMLLLNIEAFLSINCFSGKDRTGLLAALITFNRLTNLLNEKNQNSPKVLANWGQQLMTLGTGAASKVVYDNTGFSGLKLDPKINCRLLQQGGVSNVFSNLIVKTRGIAGAGATFVAKKGLTGEHQLYMPKEEEKAK